MSNTFAILCSRTDRPPAGLNTLLSYFREAGIKYHVSYDAPSMFKGYQMGIDALKPEPDDNVILCHDDIEIITDRNEFRNVIDSHLNVATTGFIGVAGTTNLGRDAVWWDMARRQQGLHSGFVFQGTERCTMTPNYFGPCKNVVVLDGCFIACKKRLLDVVGLDKPKQFPGDWDFYDLLYTLTAYEAGYNNKTVPIIIMHNSSGFTRENWNLNREAFIRMFRLPVKCS